MDYRASSTAAAALPKKLGSSNGAFTSTSIYDGVFSSSNPFRGSSFSSRADDFGEIFGDSRGGSSIPVLDVPALCERKVSVDVRSSRLEYSNIFGSSGGSQGVASYEDLPAGSKKMRNFAREERVRVGTRSPSEASFSGSEDSQVLPHSSDKAKKFKMSYNRSNLGSEDGTNGTTHITQLHDVRGFARVTDGTDSAASARNGDEKAKSSVLHSTPEKQFNNVSRNGSPSYGMPPNEYGTPSPSRFFTNNFNGKGDSEFKASPSKVSGGGDGNLGSPPYFEEELDANSAAAASAAAVRKAIEQAQARIKIAKEIMERRKDMFQGNGYFNGLGAEKRREGKKAKKAIKFSQMEENAELNRFSGQALEVRCAETQAQPCIWQQDSVDGDEANEVKALENNLDTSEKKSETGKARDIQEKSNLASDNVAHECHLYRNDHESAEHLHYLEENKEEFEVGSEVQRNEEKKLQQAQSMDCVGEEKGKKPNGFSEEEEEEGIRRISDQGKKVHGKDENTDRLEEHEKKEYSGFCLEDEPKELDADTEELLEKFDCLLGGKENQEPREEYIYSERQQDPFEEMENEDVRKEDESHKIQDLSSCSEDLIYAADECRYTEHGEYQDIKSENEVKPEENQRTTEETESAADNADSEERKVTDSLLLDKKDKVVDDSNLEEARGLEAFCLSWGSLNVGEVKKKVEVKEITALNENTVKLEFTDINIEPETTGNDMGKHVSGLVSELHEDYNDVTEDDTSISSSGKGEAEAFTDDQEIAEDELSEYDDSLVDSEVNIEADWQPEMFEKEEETVEAKSNQSSDQEEEIWSVETAKEESEPQRDSIKKTDEEQEDEVKMEPERHSMEKTEEEREKEKERERERVVVERAIREARERAFAEARERAERASVEKATAEARQRMMAHAREKMAKASAFAAESINNKPPPERRSNEEARLRAQRAAVERATAEARERALEKALSDKLSGHGRDNKVRQRSSNEPQQKSSGSSSSSRNSSSSSNGGPQSGGLNEESAQRSKAKLEGHQRTAERAAKALAEKNMRDLLAQREQAEKNRLAEALDADIKRWSSGKHGNLRALLSTLQYILGAESGWQPVSLTEIVTSAAVKKAYRRATLCVHPDKLQQRGASLQQKHVCEKVFDLLKEAWNRFSAEEK